MGNQLEACKAAAKTQAAQAAQATKQLQECRTSLLAKSG